MSVPFVKQFDDIAESIANPNPNRPISNAVGQFGRQVCDSISARPDLYAPTILQSPLRAACQPYWDGQDYDGPVEEPPYTGGQCADTYQVFATSGGVDLFIGGQSPRNLLGPLGGVQEVRTVIGTPFPDSTRFQFIFAGPNDGVQFTQRASFTPDPGFRIAGIVGGAPDNCGNPPGEFVPGENPAPDPGPLPPGTGPSFDFRGNPIIILPPTIEIAPDINIELPPGEINLGGGTGGGPAAEPLPGDEAIGGGSGVGGGDSDFGDPPDGERWAGCCVTISGLPPGAGNIPQAEPESIYPRTIGNVRLRFAGAGEGSEYDTPLVNRQRTTCVWEPVRGLKPTGVRVNLLPGYSYTFRPYSVPEEQ